MQVNGWFLGLAGVAFTFSIAQAQIARPVATQVASNSDFELAQVKGELATLKGTVATLQSQNKQLTANIAELKGDLGKLQSKYAAHRHNMTANWGANSATGVPVDSCSGSDCFAKLPQQK